MPICWKSDQKQSPSQKGQNMYIKARFDNPKHLHQTTLETLKYQQRHALKLLIYV